MTMPAHSALGSPEFRWPEFSTSVTLALLAVSILYLRGSRRLPKISPDGASPWRVAAFFAGIFVVWIASASPLAELDHQMLTFHMVQHLLLMTLAAPLLLLGQPGQYLANSVPESFILRLGRLRTNRFVQRSGRILTRPAFCFLTGTAVLTVWHVPAVFDLAMRSRTLHAIELASFLAAGLLFWLPVIRFGSINSGTAQWWMPLYLFLATLPCDALSAFLAFCDRVIYPCYTHSMGHLHMSPLQDQQCAGSLMWVCVTFAYLTPAVIVTAALLSSATEARQKPSNSPSICPTV